LAKLFLLPGTFLQATIYQHLLQWLYHRHPNFELQARKGMPGKIQIHKSIKLFSKKNTQTAVAIKSHMISA